MEILIPITAFAASLLTFFAGFGLGTLLLPIFALFFPPETAVSLTAIVHLLNNLFKLGLVGKHINQQVLITFGLPGVIGAFGGAYLMTNLVSSNALFQYNIGGSTFSVEPINLVIGLLMIAFAILEVFSLLKRWEFGKRLLIPGGFLSGFFGGLSGHQGALRSAFLIKCGLSKETFIATGVSISCFVDIVRLGVYSSKFAITNWVNNWDTLLIAVLAAFAGAFLGRKLLTKTKINSLYLFVTIMLIVFGTLLASGIIAK